MSGTAQNASTDNRKSDDTPPSETAIYDCNICLDTAKDAVISMCGHLFCWPCLHQWLETRPTRQSCPVCKAGISRDKVIPVYGRGGSKSDPREKLPPRPQGQRSEPENDFSMGNGSRFVFGDHNEAFHMSFGIGGFPFGFFASTFNFMRQGEPVEVGAQEMASKLFIWIACLFMMWLLAA